MPNLLKSFPGLESSEFTWIGGDKMTYDMSEMDYAYLKNARNHLAKFVADINTEQEKLLLGKKISEFDKAIRMLSKIIRENKIPDSVAEKVTLKDFRMNWNHLFLGDE